MSSSSSFRNHELLMKLGAKTQHWIEWLEFCEPIYANRQYVATLPRDTVFAYLNYCFGLVPTNHSIYASSSVSARVQIYALSTPDIRLIYGADTCAPTLAQ